MMINNAAQYFFAEFSVPLSYGAPLQRGGFGSFIEDFVQGSGSEMHQRKAYHINNKFNYYTTYEQARFGKSAGSGSQYAAGSTGYGGFGMETGYPSPNGQDGEILYI